MEKAAVVTDADLKHAKACAEYIAGVATKFTKGEKLAPSDGDAEDVANNLDVILEVLEKCKTAIWPT